MAASTLALTANPPADDAPALVAGCRRRDPDCFTLFVQQTEPRVRRVLMRFAAGWHDVDELVQETYLRAWRNVGQFRGQSRLQTWVLRIAMNVACNWHRDRKLTRTLRGDVAGQVPARPTLPARQLEQAYLHACQELPDNLRMPFVLHEGEGLKYQEVADLLEWPIGTVMSRLHRARTTLLEKLQDRMAEVQP